MGGLSMSRMGNHVLGMEEEGRLIYREDKKEYVPAGLTPRSDVHKYRKKRKQIKRSKKI